MQKVVYLTRLVRVREELVNRIARIDQEIEASFQYDASKNVLLGNKRGPKPKYGPKDVARVKALKKKGLTLRKIASITGIPNQTVHHLLKS